MPTTNTIVIGAGQAGLAMSRRLTDRGIDHAVLERGRVADRWRSERWDSLRLLTPNWMSRLPGWSYTGPDPHGFMSRDDVVAYLDGYARSSNAPIAEDSAVERVAMAPGGGFEVATTSETWRAANVVIATGWCDQPAVPAMARRLDRAITQVAPSAYRNPDMLAPGGVLVVGAAATGVQLAEELARAGRDVVLAVGNHTRLPRDYRGMDIYWWLERTGSFDRTIDDMPDPVEARREPSVQLVGGLDHRNLDLSALRARGVELAGRLTGIDGRRAGFAHDLARTVAKADTRMRRVLADIDAHIDSSGLGAEVLDPEPQPTITIDRQIDALDLGAQGINTVIWATGFRRAYPWLQLPILDASGEIRQRQGVTPVPGLYVLGQRFQHYRSSNLIDGVGRDAGVLADCITGADPAWVTATGGSTPTSTSTSTHHA